MDVDYRSAAKIWKLGVPADEWPQTSQKKNRWVASQTSAVCPNRQKSVDLLEKVRCKKIWAHSVPHLCALSLPHSNVPISDSTMPASMFSIASSEVGGPDWRHHRAETETERFAPGIIPGWGVQCFNQVQVPNMFGRLAINLGMQLNEIVQAARKTIVCQCI